MTGQEVVVIHNGTVLTPFDEIRDGVVVVQGARILSVGRRGELQEPPGATIIDAGGGYIVPGLIDIHVHGGKGADVMDATPEALETMSSFFATRGVTAFAATMITAPMEDLLAGLENARSVIQGGGLPGAEVLGVHQEGPFLNPAEKGCHPAELLVAPTPERYAPYLEYADVLVSMTLAPELDGAVGLVRGLCDAGVVAAAGHTSGVYHEIVPAIDAGLSHVVHFFCNMSTLRRAGPGHDQPLKRVAGAVETFLYDDRVTTELIGDGWHVGDTLMKLAVKVKGVERVCWVTDAMTAAGMPAGRYFVGGVEAIVEHGIARLPDNTAYASSVTTLDVCVRNGVERVGLSLRDSVRMASLT
ncbi:MAG TPA: N-acetylglucosamine-6-phosphate deacetylase, partial [Anaerolineae bacterium]|nr:N-acetylglucosamine-6-phosphate deacetylase [Anaerolineae bacterium]